MALYKAHTKEGAKLRKYYKHSILQLLQFNPTKNNILSYFTKDIINPLELKNYRQIKTNDKKILIMYGKKKLFIITRSFTFNYITNVCKTIINISHNPNNIKYIYKTLTHQILFDKFKKLLLVSIDNILYNGKYISFKPKNNNNLLKLLKFVNCNLIYKCIYNKNIRYRTNITFIFTTKHNYTCFKFTSSRIYYKTNMIALILSKSYIIKSLHYKQIIIIPNKYEFALNYKLFDLFFFS